MNQIIPIPVTFTARVVRRVGPVHPVFAQLMERRVVLGMSYAELAKRSGYGASTIKHHAAGRGRITLDFVEDIARALGCEIYLLDRRGN